MEGRDLAARGDAGRADRGRRRATARGSSRSTPASRARSCATCASAARGSTLLPCTHARRTTVLAQRARRGVPRQRPRRPGRARPRGRDRARAGRQGAGVRHLPRPPAAVPRGRPRDVQAAASATAAPTIRSRTSRPGKIEITAQNHGFAVRRPGRRAHRRRDDEPVRWETDFGAAELSHVNLYDRTVEGLVLLDVPGRLRPVPPGGRPRPARLAASVRPVPGDGRLPDAAPRPTSRRS